MHLVPSVAAAYLLHLVVHFIRCQFVVVELILNGVGGVLYESVEAVGTLVHALMGSWSIKTPCYAVVLPNQILLAVRIYASVGCENIVLGLTLIDGKNY